MDRTAVKKGSLHGASSDAAFWRSHPPQERLCTVEALRREYHDWNDDDSPRLQRVCRVRKRA